MMIIVYAGVGTAAARTLNRTLPEIDRTYPNPVYYS